MGFSAFNCPWPGSTLFSGQFRWCATAGNNLNIFITLQASWAAFMPLAVIVITLSAASAMGSAMGKRQATWLAATDRRIKLIVSGLCFWIYPRLYAIQVLRCLEPYAH
jgi:hypothetical protein